MLLAAASAGAACSDHAVPATTPVPAGAASIAAVTPTELVDTVTHTVTITVRVLGASGAPAANVAVHFAVNASGGTIAPATAGTNGGGLASASWTLAHTTGTDTATATVEGQPPVSFVATRVAAAPVSLTLVSGDGQDDSLAAPLAAPLAVRALDTWGNPVPGVPVHFSVDTGGGALAPAVPHTDSLGLARATWTLGADTGVQVASASFLDASAAVHAHATAHLPVLRARALAAGMEFTCAVDLTGHLFCWGNGASGELATGATDDRTIATPVARDLTFTSVAAGDQDACALSTSGDAWCWGSNALGADGDGTTTPRAQPVMVPGVPKFVAIAVSYGSACALTRDEAIYCWGAGTAQSGAARVASVSGSAQFASLARSGTTVCAVNVLAQPFCMDWAWTSGASGPLLEWQPMPLGGAPALATMAGDNLQACGVTTDTRTVCWDVTGRGASGRGAPSMTATTGDPLVSLSGSYDTICGLTSAGVPWCWGVDAWGRFGVPSAASDTVPPMRAVRMPLPDSLRVTAIQQGRYHTCAIATTSIVYCLGQDLHGVLGDGHSGADASRVTPAPVLHGH